MACTAKAFCYLHNIEHDIDKAILEHEFSKIYENNYGFLSCLVDDCDELIFIMQMIERHGFDKKFIETVTPDLEMALIKAGDNFFYKQNLSDRNIIKNLYQIVQYCIFDQSKNEHHLQSYIYLNICDNPPCQPEPQTFLHSEYYTVHQLYHNR